MTGGLLRPPEAVGARSGNEGPPVRGICSCGGAATAASSGAFGIIGSLCASAPLAGDLRLANGLVIVARRDVKDSIMPGLFTRSGRSSSPRRTTMGNFD